MRSPESRVGFRPGRAFEEELNLRYLSPGAFTILSPEENGSPPDPPTAPPPYRLSPNNNTRRSKNQSFSIIAEPVNSALSRSPSPPSGRVSPFRGRGFNPSGSRHASPAASPPPPDDHRSSRQAKNSKAKRSNIPQLRRRNSSVVLTDDSSDSSPKHRQLRPQLSKSLNHIGPQSAAVIYKPPTGPSPRRSHAAIYSRNNHQAFTRLSPIIGSSPEPSSDSKSQSSPSSRIPKSYSSPSSRKPSPSRDRSPDYPPKRASTRVQSRAASRATSRNPSREVSPSNRPPISPTKIPVKNYRNVPAKVNSNNAKKSKPKVPNRNTAAAAAAADDLETPTSKTSSFSRNNRLNRSESVTKLNRNVAKNNAENSKNSNNNRNNNNNSKSSNNNNATMNGTNSTNFTNDKKPLTKRSSSKLLMDKNGNGNGNGNANANDGSPTKTDARLKSTVRKVESVPKLTDMLPSASTVVSTTTSAVTQPLKIDAKLETPQRALAEDNKGPSNTSVTNITYTNPKETPMYMDEDSQTLLKDHNISKLSPAASAVISINKDHHNNNNNNSTNKSNPNHNSETSHSASSNSAGNQNSKLPNVEVVGNNSNGNSGQSGTATTNANIINVSNDRSKLANEGTADNVKKFASPDESFGAKVHYEDNVHNSSVATTVVLPVTTAEVKPIKITVQGKPDSVEVQSGNVRFPPNATNGVASGAGAPQRGAENAEGEEAKENRCKKFMNNIKRTVACANCKRGQQKEEAAAANGGDAEADNGTRGCFGCFKKKKLHDVEEIIISAADDEVEEAKKSFWQRMKCCKSNKVSDSSTTGCFGRGKRKQSWAERRDSILSDAIPLTRSEKCRNFFKALFCCCGCGWASRCCRKTPPPAKIDDLTSRRASLLSKKKSLTPTVLPQEDPKNKLDPSLVEYTSTMKAAIPVLPIFLAYFCLFFNIFAPGTGTVFSGLFCLCMGKPRFSQKDGPKPRVGSFFINTIIGAGQLFTVLFCLVGWGWSIWWGVIMVKVARKYKKLKLLEERMEAQQEKQGSNKRDVEKGRS